MKRSTLLAGVVFAALFACNDKPADAGTTEAPAPVDAQLAGDAGSNESIALAKTYDCGGKGQKPCPMQGWMKSVMGAAMGSGDAKKIAAALDTIASKPVAGYDQWVAIAKEGADKARADDIDGAKASCKKCHSLYQKKYRDELRDQPW